MHIYLGVTGYPFQIDNVFLSLKLHYVAYHLGLHSESTHLGVAKG